MVKKEIFEWTLKDYVEYCVERQGKSRDGCNVGCLLDEICGEYGFGLVEAYNKTFNVSNIKKEK